MVSPPDPSPLSDARVVVLRGSAHHAGAEAVVKALTVRGVSAVAREWPDARPDAELLVGFLDDRAQARLLGEDDLRVYRSAGTAVPGTFRFPGAEVTAEQARAVATEAVARLRAAGAPWLVADRPIASADDDLLGFRAYANAIAAVLDHPETTTPMTFAIHAPWGAGKSSLGRLVREALQAKPAAGGLHPHVTVWFAAWMHDDAPDLSTALIAAVAQAANRRRPWLRQITDPLPQALRPPPERRNRTAVERLTLAVGAVGLLAGVGQGLHGDPGGDAASWQTGLGGVLALLAVGATRFRETATSVGAFVEDAAQVSGAGSAAAVRDEIAHLVDEATPEGSRMVVFVDDLERCRSPRCVDVLEAINQFMGVPGLIFVVMTDVDAIAVNAEIKHGALVDRLERHAGFGRPGDYGQRFLQKIIQVQFELPVAAGAPLRALTAGASRPARPEDDDADPAEPPAAPPPRRIASLFDPCDAVWRGEAPGEGWLGWMSDGPFFALRIALRAALEWRFGARPDDARELPDGVALWSRRAAAAFGTAHVLALTLGGNLALAWVILDRAFAGRVRADVTHGIGEAAAVLLGLSAASLGVAAWAGIRAFGRERELVTQEVAAARTPGADDQILQFVSGPTARALARQAELLGAGSESRLFDAALREAGDLLPRLPRAVKRLVNRLRLLVYLAEERDMMGGSPALTAAHLGHWAVLHERWPRLGLALRVQPGVLANLRAADPAAFGALAEPYLEVGDLPEDLGRLCRADGLVEVVGRIAALEPAAPAARILPGRSARATTTTGAFDLG